MQQLKIMELSKVSGGGDGVFYFGGKSYPFSCPAVDQTCYDTYLSYLDAMPPGTNLNPKTVEDVLTACGGMDGINAMTPSLNDLAAMIQQDYA